MSMGESAVKSVVIIEDHPSVRFALKAILSTDKSLDIIGEAGNGREGMTIIMKHLPDLVILDITLPDINGFELIRNMKRQEISSKIIIFSSHESRIYANKLSVMGGNGYISKSCSTDEILSIVNTVLSGFNCFPANSYWKDEKIESSEGDALGRLTQRELTIFIALAKGSPNKDIAQILHISEKTVSAHKANIKKKLNLNNSTEMTSFAVLHGLINQG